MQFRDLDDSKGSNFHRKLFKKSFKSIYTPEMFGNFRITRTRRILFRELCRKFAAQNLRFFCSKSKLFI